jgi:hypothetical protein
MSIKRVSMLTFHYAHNWGAVLQALALKKRLELFGVQVEIVNYRNKKVENIYKGKLRWKPRREWLLPQHWSDMIKQVGFVRYAQVDWTRQQKNFREFIAKVVQGKGEVVPLNELKHYDTDMFIVGSDQVWDKHITGGLDRGYFLDFDTYAKKVSYAASMTSWTLTARDTKFLSNCLNDFDAISVREKAIADKLSEFTNKQIFTVLDPTLLLDANAYTEWEEPASFEIEKYVFAYFVTESKPVMQCAQKIASELNLKLIELHYYKRPELDNHHQITDISPAQFLWYIKTAEFVVTNSFHGTVFSILYERLFYTVYKAGKNQRAENLLACLDLSSRHIESSVNVDICEMIDFENVRRLLDEQRLDSLKFLKTALGISDYD